MKVELDNLNVPYESQVEKNIFYSGVEVGKHKIDLVVDGKIVVELKSAKDFEGVHFSQIKSYLKATGLKVGLLINFGKDRVDVKRFVL